MLGAVGVWLVNKPVNNCGQCRGKQDSAETDQRNSRLDTGRQPENQSTPPPVSVSPFTDCEVKVHSSQVLMCESDVPDQDGQKSRSLTGEIDGLTGRPAGLCANLT